MRLVIADTSPINYRHIDTLPELFERIILPTVVMDELDARQTASGHVHDVALEKLGAGEEDAISLAIELRTNFRYPQEVMDEYLAEDSSRMQ